MSFYEVGSYVLDMPHQYEASIIIINSDFFNSLSEEDQAVINEARRKALNTLNRFPTRLWKDIVRSWKKKEWNLLHLMIRRSGKMRQRLSIRNLRGK